ncbi:RsmB/NOP family class I SAM-dependent RNA methyltransferase [Bacteroides sp. OttesenSCG-928-D19]|nr:RsmB/NOP family class I SAM-dependent RNA methyltransferase [Bacteroides sp. OttesenSCG-928-N06]MDL2305443.1 RsmB/NOP family class I SAM-dependent RNA methyltransferase [Bacteroides sp. OttesenSCG-928-D19]
MMTNSFPADFVAQVFHLLGDVEGKELLASLSEPALTSIRINPLKITPKELQPVPWCASGYYLPERLTFTFDPLFHAGAYYVQEASSMFLEQAVNQCVKEPALALDLCAAPGGKSTHLRSLLPEGSLLVANEVIRNRSQILAENITKWGHPDVMVTNNDPADFGRAGVQFDFILADVPCSGEGMFRKDEGAINEWSPANVEICRQRQRRIIADIWPCLKPNGILVYSTCTFNTKENEENVGWIMNELGAQALKLEIPEDWGVTGNLAGKDFDVYRFLPHKVKGEGFFMAVLQKKEDNAPSANVGVKEMLRKKMKKAPKDELVLHSSYYCHQQDIIVQKMRVLQSGVLLGEAKGKDIIPSQALAMADVAARDSYPRMDVTYEQAIAYLRRETIVPELAAPRGYILLTYKDIPLGFVKNIGNRANNLYPSEWRIRSGYLPEEIRTL